MQARRLLTWSLHESRRGRKDLACRPPLKGSGVEVRMRLPGLYRTKPAKHTHSLDDWHEGLLSPTNTAPQKDKRHVGVSQMSPCRELPIVKTGRFLFERKLKIDHA